MGSWRITRVAYRVPQKSFTSTRLDCRQGSSCLLSTPFRRSRMGVRPVKRFKTKVGKTIICRCPRKGKNENCRRVSPLWILFVVPWTRHGAPAFRRLGNDCLISNHVVVMGLDAAKGLRIKGKPSYLWHVPNTLVMIFCIVGRIDMEPSARGC